MAEGLTPPSCTYIQGSRVKNDTKLWTSEDARILRQNADFYRRASQEGYGNFSASERAQFAEDADFLERKLEEYDNGTGFELTMQTLNELREKENSQRYYNPSYENGSKVGSQTEYERNNTTTEQRTTSRSRTTGGGAVQTTTSDAKFKTEQDLKSEGYHRRNIIDVITGNGNGNGSYYVKNR